MTDSKKINISFNPNLFSKIPQEKIKQDLEFLINTFKNYENLFHTKVSNEYHLLYLTHLSYALKKIKHCEGFKEHIKEYDNDINSTHLVTTLASYLIDNIPEIILEPNIKNYNKKPDILANISGQEIYFECKNPKQDILRDIESEHEEMYTFLSKSLIRPCDVSITYENLISEEKLLELAKFIEKKLPLITGEGEILNYGGVKIEVTSIREEFTDIGDIKISRFWENYQERSLYPGTLINRNGIPMLFFKKNTNAFTNIENQLKKSKNKVPKDKPLIAVINSESIPGRVIDNIEFVNSLFNENKYTSFNGVLFMRYEYSFDKTIEYKFNYINNPFAKNQIHKLSTLFKSTT